MTYDQLSTTVVVLIALVGFLLTIDKFVDLIKKYKKPSTDLATTVAKHTELLDIDHKRLTAIEDVIKETNRVQNRALLQLMNHSIDVNAVVDMQAEDIMRTFQQKR